MVTALTSPADADLRAGELSHGLGGGPRDTVVGEARVARGGPGTSVAWWPRLEEEWQCG